MSDWFGGLYFELPKLFFLIFFFIACQTLCKMKLPLLYFPHTAAFMKQNIVSSKLLFLLKWLGILMMILALMSPVKEEPYELAPKEGHEIALILDASESMRERGFDMLNPMLTRFDVVKLIVQDFVAKRKDDNLGLVVFGSYSFIASPLTYDREILSHLLGELQIGMAGKYTALHTSLAQGVNLLKMSEAKSKIAILLTDGYSTQGADKIPFDVALGMAKKEQVKVYPIGIGRSEDYNGALLERIAYETGGVAFGAASASELADVYAKIDALEKSELQGESFKQLRYYYFYPLFIALISLLLYVYLRNKRGVG